MHNIKQPLIALITGTIGVTSVNLIAQVNITQLEAILRILMNIIIGVATLYAMFKKPRKKYVTQDAFQELVNKQKRVENFISDFQSSQNKD